MAAGGFVATATKRKRLDIGLLAIGLDYRASVVKGSFRCKGSLKALGTRRVELSVCTQ